MLTKQRSGIKVFGKVGLSARIGCEALAGEESYVLTKQRSGIIRFEKWGLPARTGCEALAGEESL